MSSKISPKPSTAVEDRDEAPALDEHFFATGALRSGETTLRAAIDTITRRGRPPLGKSAKVQQSLRLSPEVLNHFRNTGKGWQARIDEALRHIAEIQHAIAIGREFPARTPLERKMQEDMKRFNDLIMGRAPPPADGISAHFAEVHERISQAIGDMLGMGTPLSGRRGRTRT